MKSVTVVAALVSAIAIAPPASAQGVVRETGVEGAAVASKPDGRAAEFTAPVSLRFGFFANGTPWGTEFRIGLSDHHSASYGRTVSLIAGMSVLRRVGASKNPASIMGAYITGGISLSLDAPDYKAVPARAFGVNAGVGRRIPLGTIGTLRPEILLMRDFAADMNGLTYPAATRFGFRLGLSGIDL